MGHQPFLCTIAILCQIQDVKWQVFSMQPAGGGRKAAQNTAGTMRSTSVTWSHPFSLFWCGLLSQGWQVPFMKLELLSYHKYVVSTVAAAPSLFEICSGTIWHHYSCGVVPSTRVVFWLSARLFLWPACSVVQAWLLTWGVLHLIVFLHCMFLKIIINFTHVNTDSFPFWKHC